MPKLELTMNQWGLVLRAVRYEIAAAKRLYADEIKKEDIGEFRIIEDRIIDMAFQLAKETEDTRTSKKEGPDAKEKKSFCPVGQQI